MPTITRNAAGNWKAIIRKTGWPIAIKTFRTKRDATDWARRVEDEWTTRIEARLDTIMEFATTARRAPSSAVRRLKKED